MTTRIAPVLVTVALITAGCGGSGGASSTDSPQQAVSTSASTSPAKPAMVLQAETICEHMNAQFARTRPPNAGLHEILRLVPARIVVERRTITELGRLTPPPSLAHTWAVLLNDRKALVRELELLIGYARRDDLSAITTLGKKKEQTHKALLVSASSAGFIACAKVG